MEDKIQIVTEEHNFVKELFKDKDVLSKYILEIDDLIDKDFCYSVVDKLKKESEWKEQTLFDYPEITDSRYSDDFFSSSLKFKNCLNFQIKPFERLEDEIYKEFEKIIYQALYNYNFIFYNFDWSKKWYNFSPAKFNKYETGMYNKIHCDNYRTMFDGIWKGVPIYSVISFLNDDYEGGELVFWDDFVINKDIGKVVVFPSNFLYPHQITEVKNGTKYSCSSYGF
jgi:hypothetical protein